MVKQVAAQFNGITMAYVMGLVNALLGVLLSFGVHLTLGQSSAIVAFINAALIVAAHMAHRLGEATANGTTTESAQETPPPLPAGP